MSNPSEIQKWLSEWLREYLFGAQGTMSVPLSMDIVGGRSLLYFYASTGDVRGVLTFSVEENRNNPTSLDKGLFIRVTSSSRFVNPSGTFSATLPGERRIVRTLFSDMGKYMAGKVQIVYKPPYIRLKQSKTAHSDGSQAPSITIFVGEVRNVESSRSVVDFLHAWGKQSQFGAGFGPGLFGNARAPPISTEATRDGITIRLLSRFQTKQNSHADDKQSELVIKVREKAVGNQLFTKTGQLKKKQKDHFKPGQQYQQQPRPGSVLILASATDPDDRGVKAMLNR